MVNATKLVLKNPIQEAYLTRLSDEICGSGNLSRFVMTPKKVKLVFAQYYESQTM